MTTLAQLADQIQTAVSDAAAATWTQSTIEAWLNKAIRDYSDHFQATVTPVLAQSIGTAAGQVIITPSTDNGYHTVAQDLDNNWRYNLDFNFTGGTSPTVTGRAVIRWQI